MIELEENKHKLQLLKEKLNSIGDNLKISQLESDIKELEKEINQQEFWENQQNSSNVLTKLKRIQNKVNNYRKLENELENLESLNELLLQDEDVLSGKYDKNNAIITLHPGAGGTESQDWAEMLYRMYCKWATNNGFEVQELDYLEGDEAGIKSVTFLVKGENAYGYLKGENGVHRLVRISPFDSGGRRHTSFASAEVLPEITEDVQLDINPDDIKMDVYRASGAGGQKVNKTSSAVRLTHIPTGIVTACQTERSQTQNREYAMTMLKSKLLELKEKEQKEKIEDLKGVQRDIAWGSQIRSYVFCPYTLVKDHRTNYEVRKYRSGNERQFKRIYRSIFKNNDKNLEKLFTKYNKIIYNIYKKQTI